MLSDTYTLQVLFLDKLEKFRELMKQNGEKSNELYEIFHEVEAIKRDSQLLLLEADRKISEWKERQDFIGAKSR